MICTSIAFLINSTDPMLAFFHLCNHSLLFWGSSIILLLILMLHRMVVVKRNTFLKSCMVLLSLISVIVIFLTELVIIDLSSFELVQGTQVGHWLIPMAMLLVLTLQLSLARVMYFYWLDSLISHLYLFAFLG